MDIEGLCSHECVEFHGMLMRTSEGIAVYTIVVDVIMLLSLPLPSSWSLLEIEDR